MSCSRDQHIVSKSTESQSTLDGSALASAMSNTTNANNKRPAPSDETWSNLSDDAQRRWRANRTAQRKFRQQASISSLPVQYLSIPPVPYPPVPAQHDGQARIELNPAVVTPASGVEGDVPAAKSAPALPPTASPASTLDSFPNETKSQTEELLHLLEFPSHIGMPSPSGHDRLTPSFHLPQLSEDPVDPASLDARFTPTSHPEDTPRIIRPDSTDDVEGPKSELDKADGRSRMGTSSASPAPKELGADTPAQIKQQPDDYLLSPLSSLVSTHSSGSKSSVTDAPTASARSSIPSESPAKHLKSPAFSIVSPGGPMKSPAIGGLGITMKMPDKTSVCMADAGETALHKAAACGHEVMTKLLLDGGADTELASVSGRRPLHLAAENGHLRVVGVLIEAGADLEAADLTGARPLHLAAQAGHEDVARFLLWKGAHVNALDRPGQK